MIRNINLHKIFRRRLGHPHNILDRLVFVICPEGIVFIVNFEEVFYHKEEPVLQGLLSLQ